MRELKLDSYKNVLPYISLSSEEIKDIVSRQRLRFINVRNNIVEWNLKLPMFAIPFYGYVYRFKAIPTQDEFFKHYVQTNQDYFKENNFNNELLEGIKARAFRAMPSLVRDLHFNKYVSENLSDCTVLSLISRKE